MWYIDSDLQKYIVNMNNIIKLNDGMHLSSMRDSSRSAPPGPHPMINV